MLQRIALFIAALAAALALAVGLADAGFAPGGQTTAPTAAAVAVDPPTDPPVQVDNVYVPAPVAPKTVVIHKNVPPTDEHHDESEDSDD